MDLSQSPDNRANNPPEELIAKIVFRLKNNRVAVNCAGAAPEMGRPFCFGDWTRRRSIAAAWAARRRASPKSYGRHWRKHQGHCL